MKKFNEKLSQLEATYGVAPPVVESQDSLKISDFIHHIFENQEKYNLKGLSKEWFIGLSGRDKKGSVNLINNVLQENGNLISKKSILEGIEHFKKDES